MKTTRLKKITRRVRSVDEIRQLSAESAERINAIKDEDIDLTDIPALTDDFWENAVVGRFYRPKKQQITVNIDADVLAWLKSAGRGYQTRLNAILRDSMIRAKKG